jgi:hypothetical protein
MYILEQSPFVLFAKKKKEGGWRNISDMKLDILSFTSRLYKSNYKPKPLLFLLIHLFVYSFTLSLDTDMQD